MKQFMARQVTKLKYNSKAVVETIEDFKNVFM